MLHKLVELFEFFGNYRYYRNEGYSFKAAWIFASMTISS